MFIRHNFLGIFWAALILVLSALPSSDFPVSPPFEHFDKAAHFFLYAVFSLILIVGFKKQSQYRNLRNKAVTNVFFISAGYGILIEFFQKFIFKGRSLEIVDLLSNFSGTIFGILVFFFIYGKSSK